MIVLTEGTKGIVSFEPVFSIISWQADGMAFGLSLAVSVAGLHSVATNVDEEVAVVRFELRGIIIVRPF